MIFNIQDGAYLIRQTKEIDISTDAMVEEAPALEPESEINHKIAKKLLPMLLLSAKKHHSYAHGNDIFIPTSLDNERGMELRLCKVYSLPQ